MYKLFVYRKEFKLTQEEVLAENSEDFEFNFKLLELEAERDEKDLKKAKNKKTR